eukprot:6512374-Lingulodinium_polyedra.AAC.1
MRVCASIHPARPQASTAGAMPNASCSAWAAAWIIVPSPRVSGLMIPTCAWPWAHWCSHSRRTGRGATVGGPAH